MIFEIVFVILLLKLFVDLTKGKCVSKKRLDGKTVLITGANSGIGFETARDLSRRGARIIMACRRTKVAEDARKEIFDETGNDKMIVKELDMSSFDSIRRFCEDIKKTEDKIDILIQNAGIGPSAKNTPEGIPLTLATNMYGPFLLTHLLIDLIKRSPDGRIIFVSSALAFIKGYVDFNQIDNAGDISGVGKNLSYNISKYGVNILVHELAKRLRSQNVTVNSLHPGVVLTAIFDRFVRIKIFLKSINFLVKSPEEGAQTTIHIAVTNAGRENTGKFFIDCYPIAAHSTEEHASNRDVLWRKCEKITKLRETDPKI